MPRSIVSADLFCGAAAPVMAWPNHMSKQLVGPNGERIIGTLEAISAVALIGNASKSTGDGGQFELEFSGDTQVYWDSQKTLERDGQRIFVDREGNEYLENTLKFIDE